MEGKAKEEMLKWLSANYPLGWKAMEMGGLRPSFQNTLIIEWLDSVGIYIFTKRLTMLLEFREWYFIITNSDGVHLNNHVSKESRILKDSRQEATEAAIKKAVEIYNARFS